MDQQTAEIMTIIAGLSPDRPSVRQKTKPVNYDYGLPSDLDIWDEVLNNTRLEFPDEVHVNEHGGSQTKLPVRMDLVPPDVLLKVAKVLSEGAEKHGANNWQRIDTGDHLNHGLTHIYRFLSGDRSEPHLVHAICRLMFAEYTDTFSDITAG